MRQFDNLKMGTTRPGDWEAKRLQDPTLRVSGFPLRTFETCNTNN